MHPELFTIQLGNFAWTAKAYSFFYFLAVATVIGGTFWLARKHGLEKKPLLIFLVSVAVGGFVGARLLHWLTNWQAYLSGRYDLFSLDMEGFAISGGILSALIIGFMVCNKLKIDFWELGDISVIFLGLGISVARLGCFLNGCCFGKTTNLPWGVHFPNMSQAHQYQLFNGTGSFFGANAVHPTQIYEAMAAIIGSLIALYIIRKKYESGVAILSFGLWLSFFRLINMHFRVAPSTYDAPKFFYPVFYLGVIIVCSVLLIQKIKK